MYDKFFSIKLCPCCLFPPKYRVWKQGHTAKYWLMSEGTADLVHNAVCSNRWINSLPTNWVPSKCWTILRSYMIQNNINHKQQNILRRYLLCQNPPTLGEMSLCDSYDSFNCAKTHTTLSLNYLCSLECIKIILVKCQEDKDWCFTIEDAQIETIRRRPARNASYYYISV